MPVWVKLPPKAGVLERWVIRSRYTAEEAAAFLGMAPETFRKKAALAGLPTVSEAGQRVYEEEMLLAWQAGLLQGVPYSAPGGGPPPQTSRRYGAGKRKGKVYGDTPPV